MLKLTSYQTIILVLLFSSSVKGDALFLNSITSNNIDFIRTTDPTVSSKLNFNQRSKREMPDRRSEELFDDSAYVFDVDYSDGSKIQIWAHSDFSSQQDAESYVTQLLGPLGRLPARMRKGLSHIVLHKGDETAFAEHLGHFFVLYSENIMTRLKNSDLEETLFHESVHATLDALYLKDSNWLSAQNLDNAFVTKYAERNPSKEDLAETALFVYTYIQFPGRLPSHIEAWLPKNIPHRLQFLRRIFSE